jgi:hypothetical protein
MKQYCKACKKEIYFLQTKSGKLIPVNADSISEDDKMLLDKGNVILFEPAKKHITHFSDCPDAKKFRKVGGKK